MTSIRILVIGGTVALSCLFSGGCSAHPGDGQSERWATTTLQPNETASQGVSPERPWWETTPPPSEQPDPTTMTVTLSSDILFQPDDANMTESAASQLGAVLMIVRDRPGAHVLVEGHADHGDGGTTAVPLSQERADSVANWFIARGIPRDSVEAVGHGDTRPNAPSDTPTNRAANRRCDITITSR